MRSNHSGVLKCAIACEYCRTKKIKCDENQPCRSCMNHGRGDLCYYPPATVRPRRSAKEKHRQLQERLERAEGLLQAAGLDGHLEVQNDVRPPASQQPLGTGENMGVMERSHISSDSSASLYHYPTETLSNARLNADGCSATETARITAEVEVNRDTNTNGNTVQQQQQLISPSYVPLPSPPEVYNELYTSLETGRRCSTGTVPLPILNVISHQQPDLPFDSNQRASLDSHGSQREASANPTSDDRPPNRENNQLQSPAVTVPDQEESPTQEEIHGPGSYLSICSQAGVKWVSERTGSSNFRASATSLANFIARSLKLQQSSKIERVVEPDLNTAWKYTQAFFDESLEVSMNVIHRDTFEARLRSHLETGRDDDEDLAWYALRNVVYAFGSRIVHYRDCEATSWLEAQIHGWQYFQNAFSVHSDLVYVWSSVAAVRALFVMALYVEGMGTPKLEYMLVSNAFRLAQAKGLASQAAPDAMLPETERENRIWLFWLIYVYEKHISFRSRRPSAIDDDEVDCPMPRFSPDGCEAKVEFFTHVIHHAQISSAVMKERLSIKSRRKSPSLLVETVQRLEARLNSWRDSNPSYLKPHKPINSAHLPPGILLEHVLWIHFSYYGTLAAIHSGFACPWNFPNVDPQDRDVVKMQIDQSMRTVADSARKMILATRSITIDAAAPAWLTYLFPLMGILNLFTYILNSPSLPSVPSDIDLLDMGAGYFGYLGFSTLSQITVSFAKDLTQWARAAAARAQPPQGVVNQMPPPVVNTSVGGLQHVYEYYDMGRCDLGLDDWWPTFFTV